MTTFTTQANKNPQRGFIALMSTILISAILMALAVTLGESAILAREGALDAEYKSISLGLAESCANVALLKLTQNYNYNGNESGISVGTDAQGRAETCAIGAITFPNGNTGAQNTALITASAQYPAINGAASSVVVSASVLNPNYAGPTNISITSWSQTP